MKINSKRVGSNTFISRNCLLEIYKKLKLEPKKTFMAKEFNANYNVLRTKYLNL